MVDAQTGPVDEDADLARALRRVAVPVLPVVNKVEDSEGPPDFWVSEYTVANYGPYPLPAYPFGNDQFTP